MRPVQEVFQPVNFLSVIPGIGCLSPSMHLLKFLKICMNYRSEAGETSRGRRRKLLRHRVKKRPRRISAPQRSQVRPAQARNLPGAAAPRKHPIIKKAGTSCLLHRFSFPIDLSSPCQLTPSLKPGGCPQNSFCLPLTIAAAGAAAEGVTAAETI